MALTKEQLEEAARKLEEQGKPVPPGLGGNGRPAQTRCCPNEYIGDRGSR